MDLGRENERVEAVFYPIHFLYPSCLLVRAGHWFFRRTDIRPVAFLARESADAEMKKAEKLELIKRMDFLRDLLKEFGLELRGYDPGVMASHYGTLLEFDYKEWKWLEPLLIELREARKSFVAQSVSWSPSKEKP